MNYRRGRIEVYVDLLRAIKQHAGKAKTRILYTANLNQEIATERVNVLIKHELVNAITVGTRIQYRITPKGNEFLTTYQKMLKLMQLQHGGNIK